MTPPPLVLPCPPTPNCVCTVSDSPAHAIAPFHFHKSRAEAKEALKKVIRSMARTMLIQEDATYLRYEFTSLLLGFVDDVEFLFDDSTKTVHFRSASRTGYSDLGVNRRRMERIRSLVEGKL